jgi:hypothetical protein
MKAYTNTEIIENRVTWAKRIAPLTMLFLIGGLITNFMSINQPQYFQLTLILLFFGFVFAIVSSYLTNRWVREPRSDQILTALLKKFGNDFMLFNYTAPPSHVLLTPTRLYTVVVKQQKGDITVKGRRFSQKLTWKRFLRLFGDENVGAPTTEAENAAKKLYKLLANNLAEEEIPEIQPLVIFSNKEVNLNIQEEPPLPVLKSNEVKSYLRQENKTKNISADQRDTLAEIIGGEWTET